MFARSRRGRSREIATVSWELFVGCCCEVAKLSFEQEDRSVRTEGVMTVSRGSMMGMGIIEDAPLLRTMTIRYQ